MENEKDLQSVFSNLDSLLSSTNLESVTEESTGFENLPDGYYLSSVDSAKLTVSSKGDPMASLRFTVVEDGCDCEIDENQEISLVKIKGTKNRKIFINRILTNESQIKRFVTEMLKFENEDGESLLSKDLFASSELLSQALELLSGVRIYINIATTKNKNDDGYSTWTNLITWNKAEKLNLPL